MKILHCCLSNFYIDNYNYQENILPSINKMDGHTVKIIASTETFIDNLRIGYVQPAKYHTQDGIEITRIPYKKYLPRFMMKKIRHYEKLYKIIDNFSPDVILFHGLPAYDLLTVAKYKKNHPNIKLYVDNHADKNNSGRNWLSKNILHKKFYRRIVQKSYNYIDKIFYTTYETKSFLQEYYEIEDEKMEFFPLGGHIFSEKERSQKRTKIRREFNLKETDILLVHSGKLTEAKRTKEILEAFSKVNTFNLKLFIIGSVPKGQESFLEEYLEKDNRISYLGWKNADELLEYLCASDLYVQPGSQSATMQNALCCGSAALLYPYPSHKYLLKDSVFYVENSEEMLMTFQKISQNREILEGKRKKSYKIAKEKLNYRLIAARLYK